MREGRIRDREEKRRGRKSRIMVRAFEREGDVIICENWDSREEWDKVSNRERERERLTKEKGEIVSPLATKS